MLQNQQNIFVFYLKNIKSTLKTEIDQYEGKENDKYFLILFILIAHKFKTVKYQV